MKAVIAVLTLALCVGVVSCADAPVSPKVEIPAAVADAVKDAAPQENKDEVVAYLLDYVAKSDCVFIRNGSEYDGKQAAAHIKSKNDYYKDEIKTPEDFIRRAATKSMLSGKPYMIKTTDGQRLRCDDWMKKALEEFRAASKSKKVAPN